MAEEERPVGAERARSNIYTVLLLVTTAAFIAALVLTVMELQDVRCFRKQIFGEITYEQQYGAGPVASEEDKKEEEKGE